MLNSKEKYYTYVYLDPRKIGDFIYRRGIDEVYCFNYEPFYIGKGSNGRINDHINLALNTKENKHFYNVIRKIYEASLEPIRFKILQKVTGEIAFIEEINLISIIGRKDKGHGPLTNKTDGGDGNLNISDETKIKISETLKEGYTSGKITIWNEGKKGLQISPHKGVKRPLPDEVYNKISKTLKDGYGSGRITSWNDGKTYKTGKQSNPSTKPPPNKGKKYKHKNKTRRVYEKKTFYFKKEGEIIEIKDLKTFCKENNLDYTSMIKLHNASGHYKKYRSYRGYERIEK